MEISLDTIIALLSLFVGGGGGAFFTWRWQRKKAKAEAAKELQDVYQKLINDIKADRDDLRKRQDELEETVRNLQRDVTRNGRQIECMHHLLCGRKDGAIRVPVAISESGEIDKTIRPQEQKNDIDPIDSDAL